MIKVAVTELEYRKAEGVFTAAAGDGIECVSAPSDEAGLAGLIREARFGVGHDGIDKALATRQGLMCTNTPGVLDDSVAEHAVALMLAAARHVPAVARATVEGRWSPIVGRELKGKTLAVIGCGAIGRRVAQIAARGLGMRVVGCEVAEVDAGLLKERYGVERVCKEFAEAVREADYVSLHIPALPATAHFMSAERLGRLADHAWLINTARGAVVDEAAVYDALAAGKLGGAALDVFEREPYEPVAAGKDLRVLKNVILTPHVGSSTQEACDRMAAEALRNIRLACAGKYEEMNLLNPVACKR